MTEPTTTEPAAQADTYDPPRHGWCCFHCGEHFTRWQQAEASDHFGPTPDWKPKCFDRNAPRDVLVAEVRHLRQEVAELRLRISHGDDHLESAQGELRSIKHYFSGAVSVVDAFNVYHSMEGRALSSEKMLDWLRHNGHAQAAEDAWDAVVGGERIA